MSFVLANRVKETTLTAGTGVLSLLGPVSNFQSFGSVLSSGDQTYYTLSNSTQWEVGIGTYLANSLRRDSVLSSSNSNDFVNLAGSTNVFIAYPAEQSVYKNTDGQIVVGSNGLLFSDGTTQTTAPTGVSGGSGIAYESDTLQTVTARGATTSDDIVFNGLITASSGIKITQAIPTDTTSTIYFDDKLKFQESGIVLLPDGGLEGQILYKTSDTNGLSWVDNYAKELREIVQNDTASQITKGTVVMAVGADGDTISVAPAVADGSILAKYMLGIASENIDAEGGRGYTTFFGPFKGFNTNAYEVGDILYIDPLNPGGLTIDQPVSPNLTMPIAIVTKVGNSSSGRLFVRMWVQQAGLDELRDVNSSGAVNGDIISYNGSIWSLDSSVARSGDNISVFNNDAGYVTPSPVSSTPATGITLTATDAGKYIRTTASTPVTINIPAGLSIPNYSEFVFEQAGSGQITLLAESGVTINTSSTFTSAAQYSVLGIKQVASNVYTAFGDRA